MSKYKLVVKTNRLIIRPLEKNDYEAWKDFLLLSDDSKNRWDMANKTFLKTNSKDFTKELKRQQKLIKEDTFYNFMAFHKKTGELIGKVACMEVTRGLSHTCYLGYGINNRYWGQGYGKEAVNGLIKMAFKNLKLHRVEAGIEPQNRRSLRLAKSVGLRKEGTKKKMIYLRDEWQDMVMYSATCEEFGYKFKGDIKRLN